MASAATVEHRALDGVVYRLRGDLDVRLPFTSAADLVVDGRLVEFTAGVARLGDDIAASLGITAFDTELSFQRGTLRTATTPVRDPRTHLEESPTLVVWTGDQYSVVTRLYGVSTSDVLAMVRTLTIAEHAEGLTLAPKGGSRFARPASVIKEVPGLGLIEMSRPTRENTAQLPPWKGVTVPTGELYRDTLSDGRPFFILSGSRVWATVVPLADTDVARVPDLVSRLELRIAD